MKNSRFIVLVFLLTIQVTLYAREEKIIFYCDTMTIEVDGSLYFNFNLSRNQKSFDKFIQKFDESGYDQLIREIQKYSKQKQLNDWFLIVLTRNVVDQLFTSKKENFKEVYYGLLLRELGLDVKFIVAKNQYFVLLKTNKLISNIPFIGRYFFTKDVLEGRFYADPFTFGEYKNIRFRRKSPSRSVDFTLDFIPNICGEMISVVEKNIKIKKQNYQFKIPVNSHASLLMKNYPNIDIPVMFNIKPSSYFEESIIEQFKFHTQNLDSIGKLRFILSFVRKGFRYKNDFDNFGRQHVMTVEEVFLSNYSDCDDWASMFYFLVDRLLGYKMILLDYYNHVNVGVLLANPEKYKDTFKGYVICEPTDFFDMSDIGDNGNQIGKVRYFSNLN